MVDMTTTKISSGLNLTIHRYHLPGDTWAFLRPGYGILTRDLADLGRFLMKGGLMPRGRPRGIRLAELPLEARQKVEPHNPMVSRELVVLGKILQLFEGMDKQEALWILRRARNQLI